MRTGSSPRRHEAQFVTTTDALQSLQPEWERLWRAVPRATPFQSPHWLLPWWRHVGRGSLATVAVRCAAHGELVALAPLYVHNDPASARRHLFPLGIATSDYLDWLVLPAWEKEALACLGAHLARSAYEWDVLEWPQLRLDSSLLTLAAARGWRRESSDGEPHPVLALEASRADGAPPIPKRMADKLRYYRRRAARAGSLAYDTADAKSLPVFLDALVRLHGQRWSLRGLPGVLREECILAWHREACALLLRAGLLRLHALRLDGELIAVLHCVADTEPMHERRHYYYLGGFDPRWRELSPGTLLVGHAIEQAIAQGAGTFDFLRGSEPYKYRWGALDQPMCTLRLWPEHLPRRVAKKTAAA
jgi:CelD/BcsL family acetyltransferase involved in cellulose biosynthesis